MELVLKMLQEKEEKHTEAFVENSLIQLGAPANSPMPETIYDLRMIRDLRDSITVLKKELSSRVKENVTPFGESDLKGY